MNTSNILKVGNYPGKAQVNSRQPHEIMKKKWKQPVLLLPPTLFFSVSVPIVMSATQAMLNAFSLRWSYTQVTCAHLKFEPLCTT